MLFPTSRLKSIRIGQILGVFLAGCLLLLSTACAGNVQAKSPGESQTSSANDPVKAYDIKNAPEGGMNVYSDVDPRRNTSGTAAKTKALIKQSERNLNQRSGNPIENAKRVAKEGAENIKEIDRNARQAVRNLPQKTQNSLEDASDRAASQMKKVRQNVDEAAESAQRSARTTVR